MVKHSCKLDGLRLPLADVEVRGRGHDCMRFLQGDRILPNQQVKGGLEGVW